MIKQEIHLENVFSRNLKCFKHRPLNIWEFIEESIRLHSKKTCIIDENKNYSYSQILKLVNSIETLFVKYNFKKKDRIGILFENDISFVIVSLYCIRRGLILVPLNPRSSKKVDWFFPVTSWRALLAPSLNVEGKWLSISSPNSFSFSNA